MKKFISILFLCSILLQLCVVEIQKFNSRQFLSEESSENNRIPEVKESDSFTKFLHQQVNYHFSEYLFSLFSREKFIHSNQHPHPVDWLETFSPPPELS